MDRDGYYRFSVSRRNFGSEEVHACEVVYTYSHVVFTDHIKDTIVAFRAEDVTTVRRLDYG